MLSSIASSLLRNSTTKSAFAKRTTRAQFAYFSSDSHDDFAPQRKVVEGEDEAMKLIKVSSLELMNLRMQ